MTGRRRGRAAPLPIEMVAGAVFVCGVLFLAGLALAITTALRPPPAEPARATRYLPGPTVTVSYLVEVTVTPGVTYGY